MMLPLALLAAGSAMPPARAIVDPHARPVVGRLETFGDWTVGCDNVRACTAASLGGDGVDFPETTVAIVRAAGPGAAPAVILRRQRDDTPVSAAVAVDGRAFDPRREAAALVAAMANGRAMTIAGPDGTASTRQSLTGLAAALRSIDAVQGRAGTVTALVAKGAKPAATVPAAAALPVIIAKTPAGQGALPPAALLAALAKRARCETRETADHWKPTAHALGGGAKLVMIPCSAGAYNISSALFVVRGARADPAVTDYPSGFDATGAEGEAVPSVVNGEFADGLLSSDAKGRGLGDCGVAQKYAWDGTRFRLAEQTAMGECRGNPHWLTVWRARVLRD